MKPGSFRVEVEDYRKIEAVLASIRLKVTARAVFLITRSGQEIAFEGDREIIDRQALASLAASSLAATMGLAKLIGEGEFEKVQHRGRNSSIVITPVGNIALLLVVLNGHSGEQRSVGDLRPAQLILGDLLARSNGGSRPAVSYAR